MDIKNFTTYTEKLPEAIANPYCIGDDSDFTIAFVLKQLGINSHVKGYYYLKRSIRMAVNNPEESQYITKNIYPALAKEFKTTTGSIEKCIRDCIKRIHCSDEIKLAYIGWISDSYTNKQLIASVAELVSMNIAAK